MAPAPRSTLTTPSPRLNRLHRDTVPPVVYRHLAALAAQHQSTRLIIPCAGRFATAAALRLGGATAPLEASDVGLLPAIIGHLADPHLSLDDLDLDESSAEPFQAGGKDELQRAAGLILAMRHHQLPAASLYEQAVREEIVRNASVYRGHIADRLVKTLAILGPLTFRVAGLRGLVPEIAQAKDALTFLDLPGSAFDRKLAEAELRFGWVTTAEQHLGPEEQSALLAALTGARGLVLTFLRDGRKRAPTGWEAVFAAETSKGTVYVAANRALDVRMTAAPPPRKAPQVFPIFDDQDITVDSRVEFVLTDVATALHYRDLFVHRLGSTQASTHYLMLVDGRVVSVLGLNSDNLLFGKQDDVEETFGITVTSRRYKRLVKLYMLALTSGEFKEFLLRSRPVFGFRAPAGIKTTAFALHPEAHASRGIMTLQKKEPAGDGWRLVYRTAFRDDTWADCVKVWLARWGEVARG